MIWGVILGAFAGGLALGLSLGAFYAAWREHRRWNDFKRNAWQTRAKPGGRS